MAESPSNEFERNVDGLIVKKLLEYFLKTFEGQYEIFSQNNYFPAEKRTGYLQNTERSTNYYTTSLIKKTVLGTPLLCSCLQPPCYIISFTFK